MLQPFERACILSALEIRHAERDVDFRIVGVLLERLLHLRHRIGGGLRLRHGRTCRTRGSCESRERRQRRSDEHGDVRGGGKTTWAHRSGSIRRSCRREDASSSSRESSLKPGVCTERQREQALRPWSSASRLPRIGAVGEAAASVRRASSRGKPLGLKSNRNPSCADRAVLHCVNTCPKSVALQFDAGLQ